MVLKQCSKCKKELFSTPENFYRLSSTCRECRRLWRQNRYKRHRVEEADYRRRYYKEHREHELALCAIYQDKNRKCMRAYARIWYWNNRDRSSASNRRWRVENKATKLRMIKQRRYASEAGAVGGSTIEDVFTIYKTQLGLCYYCDESLSGKYTIDHKIPLSRGGSNWPYNLCLACRSCNSSKKNKTVQEFLEYKKEMVSG